MARLIAQYILNAGTRVQAIDMQRRAKVIHVAVTDKGVTLFAEVLEDADTQAFDVKHLRHFAVVMAGQAVPEGAGYIGSCTCEVRNHVVGYHVYEVRPQKG